MELVKSENGRTAGMYTKTRKQVSEECRNLLPFLNICFST
jgi:hypothetical protein